MNYSNHRISQPITSSFPNSNDTLHYFDIKDTQSISTTNSIQPSKNVEHSSNITTNDSIQDEQQKSQFDILIDNKIRSILDGIIIKQQKQQQLNFISVCKTMNKTYDNNSKVSQTQTPE